MENERLEIASICAELERLNRSGTLDQRAATACLQAVSLLKSFREVALAEIPESLVVEKLKWILAEQGEG